MSNHHDPRNLLNESLNALFACACSAADTAAAATALPEPPLLSSMPGANDLVFGSPDTCLFRSPSSPMFAPVRVEGSSERGGGGAHIRSGGGAGSDGADAAAVAIPPSKPDGPARVLSPAESDKVRISDIGLTMNSRPDSSEWLSPLRMELWIPHLQGMMPSAQVINAVATRLLYGAILLPLLRRAKGECTESHWHIRRIAYRMGAECCRTSQDYFEHERLSLRYETTTRELMDTQSRLESIRVRFITEDEEKRLQAMKSAHPQEWSWLVFRDAANTRIRIIESLAELEKTLKTEAVRHCRYVARMFVAEKALMNAESHVRAHSPDDRTMPLAALREFRIASRAIFAKHDQPDAEPMKMHLVQSCVRSIREADIQLSVMERTQNAHDLRKQMRGDRDDGAAKERDTLNTVKNYMAHAMGSASPIKKLLQDTWPRRVEELMHDVQRDLFALAEGFERAAANAAAAIDLVTTARETAMTYMGKFALVGIEYEGRQVAQLKIAAESLRAIDPAFDKAPIPTRIANQADFIHTIIAIGEHVGSVFGRSRNPYERLATLRALGIRIEG